jgi:hypothetical protein
MTALDFRSYSTSVVLEASVATLQVLLLEAYVATLQVQLLGAYVATV